jgi:integrase
LPKGIRWARDGKRLLLYVTENNKPRRYICTWAFIDELGVPVPEGTRIPHPGIELASKARVKLQAKILTEQRTGVIKRTVGTKRTLVGDLFPHIKADYVQQGLKDWRNVQNRWDNHVKAAFARVPVGELITDMLNAYVERRRSEKAAAGTINRELAIVRRMLQLGFEATPQKVTAIPRFPRLKEAAPRSGFTTQKEYDALVPHASELWLRGALAVDYAYGLRRRELLDLRVFQIDLADGVIRLGDDDTKNGCGRAIAMTSEVRTLLEACCEGKTPDAFVFSRDASGGTPIRDFRTAWENLFEAAKLPLKLFHDNRRSAIRNMVRSGVDTTVAMKISGHKCDSVFRRYRIMDESDLHLAAQKIADGAARERAKSATDTKTDTSEKSAESRERALQ